MFHDMGSINDQIGLLFTRTELELMKNAVRAYKEIQLSTQLNQSYLSARVKDQLVDEKHLAFDLETKFDNALTKKR